MDYGKGWEGFTNDEIIEPCQGSECEGSELQRVKVLDYTWQKPVTVSSAARCVCVCGWVVPQGWVVP